MPTYLELERSTEQSRPIELYEVTLGTTVHRWTSAEDSFTVGSDTFEPEPGLRRGRILQGVGGRARGVEFSLPATNAFASRYSRLPPSEKATFRLFRAQRDETPTPTVVLIGTGTVFTVRWEDDGRVAKVAVRSAEEQLEQMLPRFTFMAQCNHYVYDGFCGADPAMHNHVGTVTAQDGTALTVSGVGASPHKFPNGFIRPLSGLDFRQVVAEAGDVLTLDVPFPSSLIGLQVQAFAGCDRLIDGDCALVFDRVKEFGGFPWVPKKNPYRSGVN